MSRGSQSRDSEREQSIRRVRQTMQELPEIFSGTQAIGPEDDLVITDDGPQPRVYKHTDRGEIVGGDLFEDCELGCVFYALTPDPVSLDMATAHNLLHRDGGPAVLWEDGGEEWFQFGQLHREDGPARTERHPELGQAKFWFDHGEQHRDGDLPAVEAADGTEQFFQRGQLHRDGGPAIIGAPDELGQRSLHWFQNGELHRDGDLPAVIHADGSTEYHQHGLLHREGGKPAWISATGDGVGWWVNGLQFHPDPDQPACIDGDGSKTWFDNLGRKHRVGDLPAFEGPGKQVWYLHGVQHRDGGKPAAIWDIFRGSQMITWIENGVERAELTVPDYPEDPNWDFDGDLCLTVFASKAGELGFHLETIKGIARYLATAGLQLGDEIDLSRHPKLWTELQQQIARAKELNEQDSADWAEYWWE